MIEDKAFSAEASGVRTVFEKSVEAVITKQTDRIIFFILPLIHVPKPIDSCGLKILIDVSTTFSIH